MSFSQARLGRLFTLRNEPARADDKPISAFIDGTVTLRSNRPENIIKSSGMEIGYKHVEVGDLVVSGMNAHLGGLGVSDSRGKCTPVYTVMFPTEPVDSRYVASWLWHAAKSGYIGSLSTGIRYNSSDFSAETVKRILIDYPLLEEQRRIADFLDDQVGRIDAILNALVRQESLAQEKLEKGIELIVTGGTEHGEKKQSLRTPWIADLPSEWLEVPVRYLCNVLTGSGDTQDALPAGDYPFYVRSERQQFSNAYSFDCDAVLTSGDGAGVGKIFHLVHGKFHAHQRVYVMNAFREITPQFFYYYFRTFFKKVSLDGSAKSTVDSVRRDMITSMSFVVPPTKDQDRITAQMTIIDRSIALLNSELVRLTTLLVERKSALISAAVTGKMDVTMAQPINVGANR